MFYKAFIAACLFSSAACAEDCGVWSSDVWQMEFGQTMAASVCNPAAEGRDFEDSLALLECSNGSVLLVYDAWSSSSSRVEYSASVVFMTDADTFTIDMMYQEMDGTLMTTLPIKSALIDMLRSGEEITVKPPEQFYNTSTFTLEGAGKAIETLMATCED